MPRPSPSLRDLVSIATNGRRPRRDGGRLPRPRFKENRNRGTLGLRQRLRARCSAPGGKSDFARGPAVTTSDTGPPSRPQPLAGLTDSSALELNSGSPSREGAQGPCPGDRGGALASTRGQRPGRCVPERSRRSSQQRVTPCGEKSWFTSTAWGVTRVTDAELRLCHVPTATTGSRVTVTQARLPGRGPGCTQEARSRPPGALNAYRHAGSPDARPGGAATTLFTGKGLKQPRPPTSDLRRAQPRTLQ